MKTIMAIALLTGTFCVGFALIVSEVARHLGALPIVLVSFTSGFLGSLFAQTVVRPWGARRRQREGIER